MHVTHWPLGNAREVYLAPTFGHWPFETGKDCLDSVGERCLQWETQEVTSLMMAQLPLLLKAAQTDQRIAVTVDDSALTTARQLLHLCSSWLFPSAASFLRWVHQSARRVRSASHRASQS